jgi:ABC-2 type transport system ATP-binding protein
MSCLLGLLKKDEGRIEIDGLKPEDLLFKARLGYVPERLRFDMWMKAWDFMAYHDRLAGQKPPNRTDRISYVLERVGLESRHWKSRLKSFSRGMLQRLGLAQALIGRPRYLFLDEPTSGMDPEGVVLFREIIKEESREGCLVLLSSHQLNQVERLCDQVLFIEKGNLTQAPVEVEDVGPRVLKIRWAAKSEVGSFSSKKWRSFKVVEARPNEMLIEVEGDQGAQKAIRELVQATCPIIEVVPDVSRLERYFMKEKGRDHV